MEGFFSSQVLDSVRLHRVTEQLQNPLFYVFLRQIGIRDLPDFASMAAVTYRDIVVSQQPIANELLFHELVHVEQYAQPGVSTFAEL